MLDGITPRGVLCRCVEAALALFARLARAMLVRAALPLRLLVLFRLPTPRVQQPMMSGAKNGNTVVFTWKRFAALAERINMMDLEGAPAASCQARESALGVSGEDARPIVAPRLCVVQGGHKHSPPQIFAQAVDDMRVLPFCMGLEPAFCGARTQLLHQVCVDVGPVSLHVHG